MRGFVERKEIKTMGFWEMLCKRRPGVALFDLDGTLKQEWEAIRKGKPGYVSDLCLKNIDFLIEKGWEIALVSNQAEKGQWVSETVSKLMNFADERLHIPKVQGYEAFPGCFRKRKVSFFGSPWNWIDPKRRRKSPDNVSGVTQVADFLYGLQDRGRFTALGMDVCYVGDRQGDYDYFERLVEESTSRGVVFGEMIFYKVPGSFDNVDSSSVSVIKMLARAVP